MGSRSPGSAALAASVMALLLVGVAPVLGGGPADAGTTAGGVLNFGQAGAHGSLEGTPLNAPIVGIAATPNGGGYWLVASDGGTPSATPSSMVPPAPLRLNAPIVGMAATPDGRGYWLVASDGEIFSFGNAVFHSSAGATPPERPHRGHGRHPRRRGGYWLVASDGGIFSFGNAGFHGSTGALTPQRPHRGHGRHPRWPGLLAGGQ